MRYQSAGCSGCARVLLGAGPAGGEDVAPSVRDEPRRQARASSQAGAASPRTIAAVEAVFASTHVAAATLTVRHTSAAGRPVRGSTTWCAIPLARAPAAHGRARGREPAGAIATV